MWWRVRSGDEPDERVGHALDLHHVVGHQAVPAVDEVERALRLADAALPHDQHAQAEHVHQHRVQVQAQGQPLVEERARAA